MCLYTDKTIPSYAEEDIKVYKVLSRANHGPVVRRYTYRHGSNVPLVEDVLTRLSSDTRYPPQPNRFRYVGEGYLHAWRHLSDALDMSGEYQDYDSEFRVVEMYVPKGASYYLGSDGDIAADELEWRSGAPEYNTRDYC